MIEVDLDRLLELEWGANETLCNVGGVDCPWMDETMNLSVPQRQNAFLDWVRGASDDE